MHFAFARSFTDVTKRGAGIPHCINSYFYYDAFEKETASGRKAAHSSLSLVQIKLG